VLVGDEQPSGYVREAAGWALANQRSVFSCSEETGIDGVHVLRDLDDEEWLRAAAIRS